MTDLNQADLDQELDDFDSDDLEDVADADHSYLKGMWGSFRSQPNALAEDTLVAHGMVQSFVNAFARDGRYTVVFDPNTSTAGTDMNNRFVAITPAPIADRDLTAEEAGLILTALATHEISHPRYGRMTAQAVERTFPSNGTASRLSNLLDDIRIERRFVADYPGYAGIFQPALDYIGGAGQKPGTLRTPKLDAPVNLAIAATRYAKFSDWSDPKLAAEAAWWNDWANRGSREDAPKRHVDFIREALKHIADLKASLPKPAPQPKTSQPQPQSGPSQPANDTSDEAGDTGSTKSDDSPTGESTDDSSTDASQAGSDDMSDADLNEATKPAPYGTPAEERTEDDTEPTSSCSGSTAVDHAASDHGVDSYEVNRLKRTADQVIEAARNIEDDGHGTKVDVNKSLKGITQGGQRGVPSQLAAKYIRNALMQSRTGHTEHAPFKRSGRLDQRGIARIAQNDFRLFEKRTAPSVGKYNIFVMVDASDSMTWSGGYGHSPLQQAAGVAHAMASASQSVPTVRMSVLAWTDAFRPNSPAYAGVAFAWKSGQPVENILRISQVKTGGTPDATAMGWATQSVLKSTLPDETPVIIFISDGEGESEMNERIEEARRLGIIVVGVAFGSGMNAGMTRRFGKDFVVHFQGTIEETARPLAKLFAKIVGGKR